MEIEKITQLFYEWLFVSDIQSDYSLRKSIM